MNSFPSAFYRFETILTIVGIVIVVALIVSLVWWHIRFKHPAKDRFLRVWQHPICRLTTSLLCLFLNVYSIAEDPTIRSWRNMDLGVISLSIRFIFADWPPEWYLIFAKFTLVACSVVASLAISVHVIHHRWLRKSLNLEMFEKSRGQNVIAAVCFLPLVAIWALTYNGCIYLLRAGSESPDSFPFVQSVLPISYHLFGMITSSITGCACSASLVMIVDTMLQDPTRYRNWCRRIRPIWIVYRQPISLGFQVAFSGLWLAAVWGGVFAKYRKSQFSEYTKTTETSRCFILGLCAALDIFAMTQDWEFPSFDNPLELKLVFLDVSRLSICPKRRHRTPSAVRTQAVIPHPESSPKLLDSPPIEPVDLVSSNVADASKSRWTVTSHDFVEFIGLEDVVVSGKWFNYGALVVNLYVNLSNMVQCIFYTPILYAQYVQPDSKTLWAICDPILANSEISVLREKATWEARSGFRDQDLQLHARFTGGSAITAAVISGIPVLLGLAIFLESLRKYNRHPEDVARRARLRTQGAVRKLRGALRFISFAKGRESPAGGAVDTGENDLLLPSDCSEDLVSYLTDLPRSKSLGFTSGTLPVHTSDYDRKSIV